MGKMEKFWKPLAYSRLSLNQCDQEPIAFCGAIQSMGWILIIASDSETIIGCSDNIGELFGVEISCSSLFGMKIKDLVDANIEDENKQNFSLSLVNKASFEIYPKKNKIEKNSPKH